MTSPSVLLINPWPLLSRARGVCESKPSQHVEPDGAGAIIRPDRDVAEGCAIHGRGLGSRTIDVLFCPALLASDIHLYLQQRRQDSAGRAGAWGSACLPGSQVLSLLLGQGQQALGTRRQGEVSFLKTGFSESVLHPDLSCGVGPIGRR